MFKNLKMNMKLALAFGLITLLMIVSLTIALFDMDDSRVSFSYANSALLPAMEAAADMEEAISQTRAFVYQAAIMTGNRTAANEALAQAKAEEATISGYAEVLSSMELKIDPVTGILGGTGLTLDGVGQQMATLHEALAALDVQIANIEAIQAPHTEEAAEELVYVLQNEFDPVIFAAKTAVDEIAVAVGQYTAFTLSASLAATNSSTILMLVLCIINLIAAVVLSIIMIKVILKPIRIMVKAVDEIYEGKLDVNIDYDGKDEIGQLASKLQVSLQRIKGYVDDISRATSEMAQGNFDLGPTDKFVGDFEIIETSITNMIMKISGTLGQISLASDQVALGSQQVSSGAQALAQGSTEQASSVMSLSDTVSGITDQMQENARNANEASRLSDEANNAISKSSEKMNSLKDTMSDISNKSTDISKIIKIIDDIAFQTNILALNAAVEAARAGVAGRGFAVVADEVRNLATKSTEAAKDTSLLLEDSINAINKGAVLTAETDEELSKAVTSVLSTMEYISNIAAASEAQALAATGVVASVEQISAVVQSNSATSEESAAASEELSGQASLLKELAGNFTLKKEFALSVTATDAHRYTGDFGSMDSHSSFNSFSGADKY